MKELVPSELTTGQNTSFKRTKMVENLILGGIAFYFDLIASPWHEGVATSFLHVVL